MVKEQHKFTKVEYKEPIAIIGIGCRFAGGVTNTEKLWELLCSGKDAVTEVPETRWDPMQHYSSDPEAPGKSYVREGAYLDWSFEEFDASFFGIAPREAECLDPQQRLLLEVTWEALEDSGVTASSIAGTDVGVYVGGFTMDNGFLHCNYGGIDHISQNLAANVTLCMLSNRLSYTFDLRGPSLTIDTACSSSLVALNYALNDLWSSRVPMALCGGVNTTIAPEYPIILGRGGFLAKDGRSKSFDARADGYGRGEGSGILVLKPLSAARRDGNHVYALIHHSGVNQDGRTNGITVPNAVAQEELIRKVYDEANLNPVHTVYVEAHGTGTALGDPLECNAIGKVLGQGRAPNHPLIVGSIKSSIGHTEAAAGVAGVIKAVLCLQHRAVPPQANLVTPNPAIDFSALGIRLPRQIEKLTKNGGPLQVSVNSFGYGGTNAHVILSAFEEDERDKSECVDESSGYKNNERNLTQNVMTINDILIHEKPLFLLPLSTRNSKALESFASACADLIDSDHASLASVHHALCRRRDHHDHRLAVVGANAAKVIEQLRAYATNSQTSGVVSGQAPHERNPGPVFVFTGMGTQWWGMGRELWRTKTIFRDAAEQVDAIFKSVAGWSILSELLRDEHDSRILRNEFSQPANFLIQAALTELWDHWGIRPGAIIGHSVGEVSAAYVSGALTLEEAVLVSFHRSQAQQRAAGLGKMLAVGLSVDAATELVCQYDGRVDIAAINSPNSCTLAGDADVLAVINEQLTKLGIFCRMLMVEVAYHSFQMDTLQDEILTSLASLNPVAPCLPLYSTITGTRLDGVAHDASYWWRNIREPVRFAAAVHELLQDGFTTFLEVGPHPALAASIRECAPATSQLSTLMSLNRKLPECATMLESLGRLYILGHEPSWEAVSPPGSFEQYIKLPSYPWQHEYHWHETEMARNLRRGRARHPLLGLRQPGPGITFMSQLTDSAIPWLTDHCVENKVILPAAAFIETFLAARRELNDNNQAVVIENIEFQRALIIEEHDVPRYRIDINEEMREIKIYSQAVLTPGEWILHATSRFSNAKPSSWDERIDMSAVRTRCNEVISVEHFYDALGERNLHYGSTFQTVKELLSGSGEVLAHLLVHSSVEDECDQLSLHPTLLDGAFQAIFVALGKNGNSTYLPISVRQIVLLQSAGRSLWVHVRLIYHSARIVEGDLTLVSEQGEVMAQVIGLRCQKVGADSERARSAGWYHEMRWIELESAINETFHTPVAQFQPQPQLYQQTTKVNQAQSHQEIRWVVQGADDLYTAEIAVTLGSGVVITHEASESRVLLETIGDVDYFVWIARQTKVDGDAKSAMRFGGDSGASETAELLLLVQLLASRASQGTAPTRLIVITRHAQAIELGDTADPAQAALWGMARVVMTEYPELRTLLIDLNPFDPLPTDLLSWIISTPEDEIAIRNGTIRARRISKLSADIQAEVEELPVDMPFVVAGAIRKSPDGIIFHAVQRRIPNAGEIEIRVRSAPFTFRDVVQLLGIYSDVNSEPPPFGLEACGEVVAIGEGVSSVQLGDVVLAMISTGTFRSYATLPESAVILLPQSDYPVDVVAAQGASSFVTALYALGHIAHLQAGEIILMHLFAGGVALAVLQIAREKGAVVYATAETVEQKEALLTRGVRGVFDTHATDFCEQVMQATNGKGVDVVLNLRSGEIVEKTLSVMAPLGRFIEIGKRDILDKQALPLAFFDRGLTYAAIDPVHLWHAAPAHYRALMQVFFTGLTEKRYTPVEVCEFPIGNISDACRMLSQSRNVGLVCLRCDQGSIPITHTFQTDSLCRADGTYLITGGFGGFGLALAEWLTKQGARHLVLMGRSIPQTEDINTRITALEKLGVHVVRVACDVSREADLGNVLDQIRLDLPPLRGVFHAAAVLVDDAIITMNKTHIIQAFGPKVDGALLLDRLTTQDPIEHFVLFSSGTVLIGNRGQANYVAANTALDALAWRRRASGLPGLSVQWGAISDVGVAARDIRTLRHLEENIGVRAFAVKDALDTLGTLMHEQRFTEICVMDVNWKRFGAAHPQHARSPRFQEVIVSEGISDAASKLWHQLRKSSPTERITQLTEIIQCEVGRALGATGTSIDVTKPLAAMGLDSMMAVELQIALQDTIATEFSSLELASSGMNISKLVIVALERAELNETM